jgi:ABC-type branched-subunit amino acid transport system ATPase component
MTAADALAVDRLVLGMGVVHVPQNHSLFREMTVRENIAA